MKKNLKELIIILIQTIIFYMLPLFAGPTDAMGLVILIILFTFLLSIIIGIISKEYIKYLYPVICSIIFIPSIFIYYNESALIHSLWYFIVSIIGLLIGTLISKLIKLKNRWNSIFFYHILK